jgi:hypothetical protein
LFVRGKWGGALWWELLDYLEQFVREEVLRRQLLDIFE